MPVTAKKDQDQEFIERAYELAYFIHANRGIALCVAEDAWRKLDLALGRQFKRRYYHPKKRRRRMRVSLPEEHVLQCLVYAQSDPWERCTERGDSPYPLTEEDMIIRFIKHLVRITLRRNSLYVTVGVGQLLHEYRTSEVLQMYDVLLWDRDQSGDKSFVRSQRKVLMCEITERFADHIQTVRTAERGERFVTQPTTPQLIDLVQECLRRFMPWGTACVVPDSFPAGKEIPGFRFLGTEPDLEHPIEMNRVHTILHPTCFSQFTRGLEMDPPEQRLAVPAFAFSTGGEPRGDRFHPPKLDQDDFLRLRHRREEEARRRRVFLAQRLDIYVDGTKQASFDPQRTPQIQLEIGSEADVLEVRSQDAEGELALAVLLVRCDWVPEGESFRDGVVLEGGQKVTIQLTPHKGADGAVEGARVEVSYTETAPLRAIPWLAKRLWFAGMDRLKRDRRDPGLLWPAWSWAGKAGAALAILMIASLALWTQWPSSLPELPPAPRAELPPAQDFEPISPTPPESQAPKETPQLVAQAIWSFDAQVASRALSIEATRAKVPGVDLSGQATTLFLGVPRLDEESRPYIRYRIALVSPEGRLWQRTLRAPTVSLTETGHILKVTLFPQRLPKADWYELQVHGQTRSGWQPVGQALIEAAGR
jgi:hypothetical protein